MKHYIEAYDFEDKQILGNLDGQGVWTGSQFRRSSYYKNLRDPNRPLRFERVKYWRVVSEHGREICTILNTANRPQMKKGA
jgi:hypothetical protein